MIKYHLRLISLNLTNLSFLLNKDKKFIKLLKFNKKKNISF